MKKITFFAVFYLAFLSITAGQGLCDDRFLCQCSEIKSFKGVEYRTAPDFSGNDLKLKLDIYTADDKFAASKRPTIIFVHGGAFVSGDKTDFAPACEAFAKLGYTTATVQYRLGYPGSANTCNAANWPEMKKAFYRAVQDAGSAVNFLVDNAGKYNVDPDNIVLMGYSAGAVTVLHTAYCKQAEMDKYDPSIVTNLGLLPILKTKLKGVVSLAGFLGSIDFLDDSDKDIPLLMFHGTCDYVVGYNAANCLPICFSSFPVVYGSLPIAEKAKTLGMPYQFITYCGQGHDLLPPLSAPVTCSTTSFIQNNLLCAQPIGTSVLSYIPTGNAAACTSCIKPPVASVNIPAANCGAACSAASNYCKTSSVEDPWFGGITLYPNPVDQVLSLDYGDDLSIQKAWIINALGQTEPVVITNNNISTAKYGKGMYWLKLQTNQGEFILKFVK